MRYRLQNISISNLVAALFLMISTSVRFHPGIPAMLIISITVWIAIFSLLEFARSERDLTEADNTKAVLMNRVAALERDLAECRSVKP